MRRAPEDYNRSVRSLPWWIVVIAGSACSSGPSNLPPLLTEGTGAELAECEVGTSCTAGEYCIAPSDAGCAYLYCGGPTWTCSPDGGVPYDGGSTADAGPDSRD